MKIAARNQFKGKITSIKRGAVNGVVTIDVNGTPVTSIISLGSIDGLGLSEGKEVLVVVKATEVMVGIGEMTLSARNKFPGRIVEIEEGMVNGIVAMEALGNNRVYANISMGSIKELGLAVGQDAVAVIKSTSVMVGLE